MMLVLAQQSADYAFNHYAALGILLLMAIGFGVANVALTTFLGPSRKGEVKGTTYESGMNPFGSARRRFNVRFYIVAMTFLLFDVEIVFLYPWAVTFKSLVSEHGTMFLSMLSFVGVLLIAYIYALKKGALSWSQS